jgi:hypothetical protein
MRRRMVSKNHSERQTESLPRELLSSSSTIAAAYSRTALLSTLIPLLETVLSVLLKPAVQPCQIQPRQHFATGVIGPIVIFPPRYFSLSPQHPLLASQPSRIGAKTFVLQPNQLPKPAPRCSPEHDEPGVTWSWVCSASDYNALIELYDTKVQPI